MVIIDAVHILIEMQMAARLHSAGPDCRCIVKEGLKVMVACLVVNFVPIGGVNCRFGRS